ncbi:hypothetical protein [Georgenia subflava]|uniref:DUF3618 domain-containing protein n=1 Tax=Georgenia subflava TaxID=1622177 RepID=A0A6N7EHB4_9MICO|nr:hypothetical protein [Georgenia subflava]MPV36097.1 hypothetical protein [Georgenia subflava]
MTEGTSRPGDPFGTGGDAGRATTPPPTSQPPAYPPVREPGAGAAVVPPTDEPQGTKDTAKEEASHLAGTAKEDAGQVKDTAKDAAKETAHEATDQARRAATEAKNQAKDLFDQTRGELTEQTSSQQRRLAGGLRSFSGELSSMADGSQEQGLATDLAKQASSYVDKVGRWLEDREPGDVLDEVSRYARRHPGTFMVIAAGLGLVAGRVARSLKDSSSGGESGGGASGYGSVGTQAGSTSRPAPAGYPADYGTGGRYRAGEQVTTEYAPPGGTPTTGTTGPAYTAPTDPPVPGTGGVR